MKWKYFFGILIILASCQKNNNSDVISTRFVHKYGFDISKDEWKERGKNGKIIKTTKEKVTQTYAYKNGILHGIATITYPNSMKVNKKLEYDEGNLVKATLFQISGIPISETTFEKDNKTILFWDKQGVPLRCENYEKNLLMGAKYFNENNKVEFEIKDGNGIRIKNTQTRKMLSKEEFKDGKMTSRITYHPNGEMQSKSFFKNYKLHGIKETYSPIGNLLSKVNWIDGKKDGAMKCFRNQKIYMEIPYIDGKKEGIEKEYDLNGNLVKEIHWENDKRHGTSRYYYEDYTDVQWYWKGIAVDLEKFQALESHEQLMVELNWSKASLEKEIKK